jgi:hypothetical protein
MGVPNTTAMRGWAWFAIRNPTRHSKGIHLETLNAFAAGAIGDAFMQISAKPADPNS